MKIMRVLYISLGFLAVSLLVGLYAFFLYGVPKFLANESNLNKCQTLLRNKTSMPFVIKGLDVKTYPTLKFEIKVNEISLQPIAKKQSLKIDKISYSSSLYNLFHAHLDVDNIYADLQELKKYKYTPKKEKRKLNFTFFPITNIKHAFVSIDNDSKIIVDYIKSREFEQNIHTKLLASIKTSETKSPMYIGRYGEIIYGDQIYFENFSVELLNSKLYISGDKNKLKIAASDLPADELEKNFIYFYKLRHPNKKNFIENFSDFKGTLDVDLTLKNRKFYGKCIAKNLAAKFSDFKIDVVLPRTVFNFNKKHVDASTTGLFGTEPVQTDFNLEGIATDDLHVSGNVHSVLTNKITQKYFPLIKISGNADAKVRYVTHNQSVNVFYTLGLNKESDLIFPFGNLGNKDKPRKISMQTHKNGDPMNIKTYGYSIFKDGKWINVINGDGSFKKIGKRYKLSDISLKTNGVVPLTYIQSLLHDYVKNGTFSTNLRYDNMNQVLSGNINLYDISHSDFLYLKETNITMKDKDILFKSNGTFFGSPITLNSVIDNNIQNNVVVKDIDIHLHQFHPHRVKIAEAPEKSKTSGTKNNEQVKKPNVIVQKGKISVDRIYSSQFEVKNTVLYGNLKDNIVHFVIPEADYAKGILKAKGTYNLANHSSDINFSASDIDSDVVVTNFFKLPDFARGKASATLHLKTKNKLNDVKADATFLIIDGSLPKIATKEFQIGQPKKNTAATKIKRKIKDATITLAKITNIDFSKPHVAHSNLYGTFKLDNDTVKDARIFSKSDYVALVVEGQYSIESQEGELYVWGKRNKTKAKKIRIFKIPLNLIYNIVFRPEYSMGLYKNEISQIPEIKSNIGDEIAIFRVFIKGNLNSKDKIKVELKDLR